MGAQLVLILSTSDRRLRKTVREWKRIAVDTFRGEPEFSSGGEREAIVELFRTCTAELIQEANKLGLDPRPIQEFFTVVSAWNHEQSAPDRKHLRTMLEGALLASDTVAAGIRRRAVRVHPADPSIPSITLPVPPVVAVEGPPIVLIPPLITDFISEWNATHPVGTGSKVPEPDDNDSYPKPPVPGLNGVHPTIPEPERDGIPTEFLTRCAYPLFPVPPKERVTPKGPEESEVPKDEKLDDQALIQLIKFLGQYQRGEIKRV
jgi:hypothetical protein